MASLLIRRPSSSRWPEQISVWVLLLLVIWAWINVHRCGPLSQSEANGRTSIGVDKKGLALFGIRRTYRHSRWWQPTLETVRIANEHETYRIAVVSKIVPIDHSTNDAQKFCPLPDQVGIFAVYGDIHCVRLAFPYGWPSLEIPTLGSHRSVLIGLSRRNDFSCDLRQEVVRRGVSLIFLSDILRFVWPARSPSIRRIRLFRCRTPSEHAESRRTL
jgi:hypothetical protein